MELNCMDNMSFKNYFNNFILDSCLFVAHKGFKATIKLLGFA